MKFAPLPYKQLCDEVGRKLRAIRLSKKMTILEVEGELQLRGSYEILEKGLRLPNPAESERIMQWAFEGIRFRRALYRTNKERLYQAKCFLFPGDFDLVRRKARDLGMSIEGFMEFAALRLAKDTPVISTYRDYAREYSIAKLREALKDPNIKKILDHDSELVVKKAYREWEAMVEKRDKNYGKERIMTPNELLSALDEYTGVDDE